MNCQEVTSLTHAYADRELELVRALELEKHLAGCPACSQAHENIRALKTALKSGDLYFKAPAGLSRKIRRTTLRSLPRARRSSKRSAWTATCTRDRARTPSTVRT